MTKPTRGVLLLLWPLCSCYSPNDTIATGPGGAEGPASGSSSGAPTGGGTGTDTDTSASASSTSPGPDSTAGTEDTGSSGSADSSGDASSSSASTTSADVPVCGDGVVDDGEVCDDGVNDGSYGGCMPECAGLAPHCGDAVVQPVESCDDGNAADADGCNVDCVVSGSERWTETFSGAGSYVLDANSVAVGPGDDVYVAGGEVVVGGPQAWLRRLDLDGNSIWEETYSDNEALATLAHGVDVDAAGVAYVGGLAEYGGNLGAHGWVRAYDDAAALVFDHDAGPEVFDVGVSDDGNAALVGSLIALLGIEGEPLGPLQTRRLAPDGDTLWTEDLESFPYLEPYAQRLAVDSEENIIVVANFREGTSAQAWARKFSPNGTVMWTRLLDGGAGHDFDRWLGVAAGPDNEVAIVGAVDDEAWIRLYDQDGAEQWTLAGGAAGSAVINSAIDEDGNIVLAEDSQNVGTIRKLSSIGTQLWSVEIPDFSPTDVAVDSQQNILVSGNGDGDGWVRKLAP